MREALEGEELTNRGRSREVFAEWVEHYNDGRLHPSLYYFAPAEYHRSQPERRIEARVFRSGV